MEVYGEGFKYDTLGRVNSEIPFTAELEPEVSWAEIVL